MSHKADHYFTPRPQAEESPRVIDVNVRGVSFRLWTDSGVFSKGHLDPGTRMLIEHVRVPASGKLLDLGGGYGPIGLVLAKENPSLQVYMVDANERAVNLAKRNAVENGLSQVEVVLGDGFEPFEPAMRFTAVVTNPPYRAGKKIVHQWVAQSFERLEPHGTFTCVGRTKQGIKSLARHIEGVFGNVRELAKGGGYRVLEAEKAG